MISPKDMNKLIDNSEVKVISKKIDELLQEREALCQYAAHGRVEIVIDCPKSLVTCESIRKLYREAGWYNVELTFLPPHENPKYLKLTFLTGGSGFTL